MKPIIVDSTHCHLWTDALHARQLAREALNKWDRGTYVRMTVTTVWTSIETSCQDALSTPNIGYSFKDDLDRAIALTSLPPIDWSQGLWQQVRTLQELRKSYVHKYISLKDMFPEASVAEQALETARSTISDIYRRTNKPAPDWVSLDEARGWQQRSQFGTPTLLTGHLGAKLDDPNATRIYLVVEGEEKLTTVLPSGHDARAEVDHLLNTTNTPISGIRVYDGGVLIQDLKVNMRGNA